MEQSPNLGMNDLAEKQPDYDYYDNQPGQRYMQSMRRNWNSNNRGIRSDDYQGNWIPELIRNDLHFFIFRKHTPTTNLC